MEASPGSRGWENGTIYWSEYRLVDTATQADLLDAPLRWGDSRVISLPDRTTGYIVRLSVFDGAVREYNSPAKDNLVAIERDDANRSLKIEPAKIDMAFR